MLRHGEAEGGSYFRGSTDDPLTSMGWQQMHQSIAGAEKWDVIISSPLLRCLDFATLLSEHLTLPLKVISKFSEIDFGHWEGKTAAQIQQNEPDALQKFYDNPIDFTPEQGESFACFAHRVDSAWLKILDENKGLRLLIITHAGVIRRIFSNVLGLTFSDSFHIKVNHGSISRFENLSTKDSEYCQLLFHQSH